MRKAGILVRVSVEDRERIRQHIADLSVPGRPFYLMASLSTVIASFGLLADSSAVIIGAMLVAPLMGPIFGVALSLSNGDRQLFRSAVFAELAGGIIVIGLSALVGLVALRQGLGSELLARTEPTLYDLVVAVASGLAGAYALVDPRISPALPGVAIATALAPPLATCGICLSGAHWDLALGSFLLFFGNFLCIELASASVFLALGVTRQDRDRVRDLPTFFRRFGLSIVALVAVGAVMTRSLVGLVERARQSQAVRRVLAEEFQAVLGAELTEVARKQEKDHLVITSVVLTPSAIEGEQIRGIEVRLRRDVDPSIKLIVRSILSKDADASGPVFVPTPGSREDPAAVARAEFMKRAADSLNLGLPAVVPGATLTDLSAERADLRQLRLVVRTPKALGPPEVAALERGLTESLGSPVHLIVRSVLATDADAERFLLNEERSEDSDAAAGEDAAKGDRPIAPEPRAPPPGG